MIKALRHTGGRQESSNNNWKINARGWQREEQAFLKKAGGMPSGPPAERTFSLLVIRLTKVGEKIILEMPGYVLQGGE